ncbi:MAG: peptidyl-prolyl cis-trans isomerase [Verrucomicrobiota bacterium]
MIVIAILAIPFIFYFNKTDISAERASDLGRLYDRPITHIEFQRNARLLNLSQLLGLTLWQELTRGAMSEAEAYADFTFNRLILRHEAEALGIKPTRGEIVALVRTLRPFRGEAGVFDMSKYTEFTQKNLPAMGFNEAQLEELASDEISLARVKDLLGTGVQVAESESKEYYEQAYGKLQVAVVRFREEDFEKDLKITDEDIAKYYEAHKAQFKSEGKRRVEFVTFNLSEEEKKLAGKERVDALQKAANRANDFVQAALEKAANFGEVAAKFNVPVAATEEFTAAAPDPKLASNQQLTQYAFQLSTQEPVSDAIQGPDGFYVLHLIGGTPSRPLTLDEAESKVVDAIKSERVRQLVSSKGADTARVIREALNAGTPLDKAVAQIGLTVERIPPFSILESAPKPEKDKEPKVDAPDLPMIKNAVREVNPGESTDFVPTAKGGLVAVVEKREPADPAGYEQSRTAFESNYIVAKRAIIFYDWLRDRRQAARLQVTTAQS